VEAKPGNRKGGPQKTRSAAGSHSISGAKKRGNQAKRNKKVAKTVPEKHLQTAQQPRGTVLRVVGKNFGWAGTRPRTPYPHKTPSELPREMKEPA